VRYKVELKGGVFAEVEAIYVDERVKLLKVKAVCGSTLEFTLATIHGGAYAVAKAEPGTLRQFKECWERVWV